MADSLPTPRDSPQVETTSPQDHLAQGIRFLALSKYAHASESLSYAVEALTEKNGEFAMDNVEALVLYGKALLGNAIEQSAVLGGAGPSAPTAAAPTTTTTTNNASESAVAGPSSARNAASFSFGGDGDDEDEDEDGDNEGGAEGEGAGAPGEGDEDEDDFERAFVVLDMARKTIELEVERLEKEIKALDDAAAQEAKVDKERERVTRKETLAEVHRLLGDVATESEQFEDAVKEYSAGLSILTKTRQPSDRILSEQHMMLALALEFIPEQTSRAVNHAEKAKSVLVLKLRQLEEKGPDATEREQKEVQDLKELIVDVENKIEDLKTVPVAPAPSAADLAMAEFMRQATGTGGGGGGALTASGPVNDLNSLVKKKKKQNPTVAPAATTSLGAAGTAPVPPRRESEGGGARGRGEPGEAESNAKRKADVENIGGSSHGEPTEPVEKKVKLASEDEK